MAPSASFSGKLRGSSAPRSKGLGLRGPITGNVGTATPGQVISFRNLATGRAGARYTNQYYIPDRVPVERTAARILKLIRQRGGRTGAIVAGGVLVGGGTLATEKAVKYHKTHHNKGNHRFASKTPTVKMHGRRNVRTRRDSHGRYAGSY